jgi:hypothetical protein
VPVLNLAIVASGASGGGVFVVTIGPGADGNLPADVSTTLAVGDLLVMRHRATFTATGFSDPNIANEYYPDGATAVEAGHVAIVLSGADAGDVKTIADVLPDGYGRYTEFDLAAEWEVTPATGDLVVICAPSGAPPWLSPAMAVRNGSLSVLVAQASVANLEGQAWLFLVRTADRNGNSGPDAAAPMRELYFNGAQGTVVVTA